MLKNVAYYYLENDLCNIFVFPQALGFLYAAGLGVNSSQAKVPYVLFVSVCDYIISYIYF